MVRTIELPKFICAESFQISTAAKRLFSPIPGFLSEVSMLMKDTITRFSFPVLAVVAFLASAAIGQNAAQTNDTLKKLRSIQVTASGETTNKPDTRSTPETGTTIQIPPNVPISEITTAAKPIPDPTPS